MPPSGKVLVRSVSGGGAAQLRNGVVATYDGAGFPRYSIAPDGYPVTTDVDDRMLIGYAANADRYEDWLTAQRGVSDVAARPACRTPCRRAVRKRAPEARRCIERSRRATPLPSRGPARPCIRVGTARGARRRPTGRPDARRPVRRAPVPHDSLPRSVASVQFHRGRLAIAVMRRDRAGKGVVRCAVAPRPPGPQSTLPLIASFLMEAEPPTFLPAGGWRNLPPRLPRGGAPRPVQSVRRPRVGR